MKRLCLLASICPLLAWAQSDAGTDIYKLDLEDLTQLRVTTAAKSPQLLKEVPSAIYVIQSEEIRRSGATCIPEALRLAPGVNVAQIDGNKWMVSIRGFNNRFANKLLVLVDGQSIYTPCFSGVLWDAHALPLSEVERIEVIRGPGGSLWGANAVNGVVNIITKSAALTQGGQIHTEYGTDFQRLGAQYGGKIGSGFYRVYADTFDSNGILDKDSEHRPDQFRNISTGFKFEGGPAIGDRFVLKADFQSEHLEHQVPIPTFTPPFVRVDNKYFGVSGLDAIGRWERNETSGKNQSLQISLEDYNRANAPDASERRTTLNVDYHTQFAPIGAHTLSFGLGYLQSSDKILSTGLVAFNPGSDTQRVYNIFLHDSIHLSSSWKVLAGSKFLHDSEVGWAIQPNLQLLYTPNSKSTYWYSLSRALRTPSRADNGSSFSSSTLPGPPPTQTLFSGNPDFASEVVVANEFGARFELKDGAFLDLTAFLDRYTHLRSFEFGAPYMDGSHAVQPITFGNKLRGDTAGVEVALRKKVRPNWTLAGNYSLFTEKLRLSSDSTDNLGLYLSDGRGGAAKNQFQLHSSLNLARDIEFDTDFYYVGELIDCGAKAYYKLDARLGWSPRKDLDLSFGVRNALSAHYLQAGESSFEVAGEVPRSVYVRMDWKF